MIYSYFEHVPDRDSELELRLMLHWRAHHEALGIETKILSEYQALQMPEYPQFVEGVNRLVGTAPGRPTFIRWLAMAKIAGGRGIMMDYDTFLYPVVWDDLNPIFHLSGADVQTLRLYQGCQPSLVVGTEQTFLRQAMRFAACEAANPVPDITDAAILKVQAEKLPETLTCLPFVKECGQEGWETAVAVKYGKGRPISNFRKQVIPT